jgi:hypothetical protein
VEGERQSAPEQAPAPVNHAPAVAAAIGPALGAGMGPPIGGLTTPAAALTLQRSAKPASSATSRTSPPPRAAAPTARAAPRDGEVVSQYRGGRSNRRDAASDPTDDTKIHPGATLPFYWPPVTIDDDAVNLPGPRRAAQPR